MAAIRTVMISSLARDLPRHRGQVEHACLSRHALPLMMEHLPATSADAKRVSVEMVDRCDVYVGIFGHRYGYVPAGGDVSVTEMEYQRAVERGIPRLIFVMADDHPITIAEVEQGEDATKRLGSLKQRLLTEQCVRFFNSPAALRAEVLNSLASLDEATPAAAKAQSDLSISSLAGAWRVRPLNGHPVLDSPDGPVHGGGVRLSFTLSHNGQGDRPIHLHALVLELLEHRPGVDVSLAYKIDGAAVVGAGVAKPHVFSVALRGEKVGPARWAGDAAPAGSENLLDTEPPRVLSFGAAGGDIEELQGTVTARSPGGYRLRFAFHYSVGGVDRCQYSDELRLYAQGVVIPLPDLGFTGAFRPPREPRVEALGSGSWKLALAEQTLFGYAGDDENPRALPYRTLWSMREKMQDNLNALRDDGTTLHPQAMYFAFCHDGVAMPDDQVVAVPRDDLWWLAAPGDLVLLSDGVTDHFATVLSASARTGRIQIVDEWPERSFLREGHNEEEVNARIEPFFAGVFEPVLPGRKVIDVSREEFLRVIVGLVSVDTPELIERYLDHRPALRADAPALCRFAAQLMSAHRNEVVACAASWFVRGERRAAAAGNTELAASAAAGSYAANAIAAMRQAMSMHPFAAWPFREALADLDRRYGEPTLLDALDVEVLCRLGHAALGSGQAEAAFRYLDLAVARHPFHDAAHLMRAQARMARQEPQAQVDDASEALARNAAYIERRGGELAALDPRDRHGRIDIERRIGGLQQRRIEALQTRAHGLRALGRGAEAQADEDEARRLEAQDAAP